MRRVELFVTCLVEGLYPEVGEAAAAVLERAGCRVSFNPDQTCCGQPAYNAGLVDEARRLGGKFVDDFAGAGDPIVVPSGSCADMLTHHLPELLPDDRRAEEVSGRVVELTSFLVDELGVTDLGAVCPARAVYHRSCHGLRNLGLGPQAESLLGAVGGLDLVEVERPLDCCGFGGLFAVELPEVSTAMMDSKLDQIEAVAPDLLIGGDVSCLLHLEGGLRKRGSSIAVRHLAQVLAEQ
jgi:L-lactate dehydrogenase complex protein LldE